MKPRSDLADVAMTWTALKGMARCPAVVRHVALQPDGGEQSLAMRMGSGLHAITFGTPSVVVYPDRRQGKAWESFQAEHEPTGAVILNPREHAVATAMANALRNDPIAAPYLFGPGVEHEQPMEWTFGDRAYRRAYRTRGIDFIRRGHWIGELKQSRTAQPGRFERDQLRAMYPAQVEFYDEGEAIVTKRDRDRHPHKKLIIAVEPSPPYLVAVYRLDSDAVSQARSLIGQYRSQLRACEDGNVWPGYSLAEIPFEVQPQETDDDEEMAADAGPIESATWAGIEAQDPF